MSDITRVMQVDGWSLQVGDDDEPTVLDVDLATRLGYERPRTIRTLIDRLVRDGKLKESALRRTVQRTRGRPVTEIRLTEAGALKVIAKSETALADAILDEMIDVYRQARHKLVQQVASPTAVFASVSRIGEDPLAKRDLSAWCIATAKACGVSTRAVHGLVRTVYTAPGIYMVPRLMHDAAVKLLQGYVRGDFPFPKKLVKQNGRLLKLVARDPRQPTLPHVETGSTAITPSNGGPA
jgi:hypothetical protein